MIYNVHYIYDKMYILIYLPCTLSFYAIEEGASKRE